MIQDADVRTPLRVVREREAARMLGVVPNTLAKWRVQGRGPKAVKLGRVVVYEVAEIERWFRAAERGR